MPLTVPSPEWCNARSLNFYPMPEGGGRGWLRKLLEGVCQWNPGTFNLYHTILIAREFHAQFFLLQSSFYSGIWLGSLLVWPQTKKPA